MPFQISPHLTSLLTILANKTNPIGKYSVSTKTSPGQAPTNRDFAPSKSRVSGHHRARRSHCTL